MPEATFSTAHRATNQLIRLWNIRYLPNLSTLSLPQDQFPAADFVAATSLEERTKTVTTVSRWLQTMCEMAGLQTNSLYAYVPNIIHLSETRRIAQVVSQIYALTLEHYRQQPPLKHFFKFIDYSYDLFAKLAMPALMLPAILELTAELDPLFQQLRHQHLDTQDSRALGFLTTQFHLSTCEILKPLSLYEQVLLGPYLKFIEEQVCIPWQRVCRAASDHAPNSPVVKLVEQLLPVSHDIAASVYSQAAQRYPHHRSRRGTLDHPDIIRSTLRDLTMMQGYLYLCLLEEDMRAIEQELLPLCVMVFPSICVQWELVEQMLGLLIEAIRQQLSLEQQMILSPYTSALTALFASANPQRF